MLTTLIDQELDNNPVQKSFSKAHKTYDQHSSVQQSIGDILINLINNRQYHSVIDIGCGTGVVSQKLCNTLKPRLFSALDFSSSFLNISKHKNYHSSIEYILADYDLYFKRQHQKYDLIFANMSLQWSKNIPLLIQQLYHSMLPSGELAFSIPLEDTFHEIKSICHVNEFYQLETLNELLSNQGFKVKSTFSKAYVLEFNSPSQRLKSIKNTGANHFKGHRNSTDKTLFQQLRKSKNDITGTYPLTYNIGLFYVCKT